MNDREQRERWMQAYCAALMAGRYESVKVNDEVRNICAECADTAMEEFHERFPAPNEALERAAQRHKDLVQPATLEVEKLQAQITQLEAEKNDAYLERNQCVALIARMAQRLGHRVGVARTAIDGWSPDWHGCVYMQLPTGQVSWHFHDSQAYLFADLPAWQEAWDGHSTEEKYRRVNLAFAGNASGPGNYAPLPVPTLRLEHNGVDVWSCSGPDEDVWKSLAGFARAQYMTTEQQQEVRRTEERLLEWPFAKGDRVRTVNAGGLGVVEDQTHEEDNLVGVKVRWTQAPHGPFFPAEDEEGVSWEDSRYLAKVGA